MPHAKKPRWNTIPRFPKPGTPCPIVDPEPFEAAAKAAFAAFSQAPIRRQPPWIRLPPEGIEDGICVRLRTEHPLVRSLLAFSDAFLDSGGPDDPLPLGAAQERFFALVGFIKEEREMVALSGLLIQMQAGGVSVADRLIMAAAIADLKWGRPFDRHHLLALAG